MHRGDVDDAPASTLLDHLLRGELCSEKSALEIDGEHFFVLRFGRVKYGRTRLDTRIVDHDVHAPEFLDGGRKQILQIGNLTNVGFHGDDFITQFQNLFFERLIRFWMRNVINDDIRALPRQFQTMAMPMPLLPPVTMATLSFRFIIFPLVKGRCKIHFWFNLF